MPLAATDINLHMAGIDITDQKRQSLFQAKAHGIGGEEKDAIAELPAAMNDSADLFAGQDIRNGFDGRCFGVHPILMANSFRYTSCRGQHEKAATVYGGKPVNPISIGCPRCFDDVEPLPIRLQNVFPEKHEIEPVQLDRAPGVPLD